VLCRRRGAGTPSRRGQLLIFHNVMPNGDVDHHTSHQSCPVTKGEKVVVSRFIRQDHCYLNKFFSWRKWNGNVYCEDDHERCAEWAALGHCTSSNSEIRERMVGDEDWAGFCEKTCGECRPLEDTVVELRAELNQALPEGALGQGKEHHVDQYAR
jgi:ShK domain-like